MIRSKNITAIISIAPIIFDLFIAYLILFQFFPQKYAKKYHTIGVTNDAASPIINGIRAGRNKTNVKITF